MRKIFLLTLICCLLGCSSDPVSSIDPQFWVGTWTGTSLAIYPGPDCGLRMADEPIRFEFTDSTFQYFRIGEGGSVTVAFGSGDYVVGDSTITFSNVLLQGYYPPMMNLQGEFVFGLIGSTLSLVQNENPNLFFLTYHLVTLGKTEVVITD